MDAPWRFGPMERCGGAGGFGTCGAPDFNPGWGRGPPSPRRPASLRARRGAGLTLPAQRRGLSVWTRLLSAQRGKDFAQFELRGERARRLFAQWSRAHAHWRLLLAQKKRQTVQTGRPPQCARLGLAPAGTFAAQPRSDTAQWRQGEAQIGDAIRTIRAPRYGLETRFAQSHRSLAHADPLSAQAVRVAAQKG